MDIRYKFLRDTKYVCNTKEYIQQYCNILNSNNKTFCLFIENRKDREGLSVVKRNYK